MAGLFTFRYFRILPNIGFISLGITTIIYRIKHPKRLEKGELKDYFLPFATIYLLFILSALNTTPDNSSYAFAQLQLKVQYLIIPLIFLFLPPFRKETYSDFYFLFFILSLGSAFISLGVFLANLEAITQSYGSSGTMFSIIDDHVRFSLFISLAICLGVYLNISGYKKERKTVRVTLVAGTVFLTLFLHLYAVRAGLLSFYFICILLLLYYTFNKLFKQSLLIALIICTALGVAFSFFETLKLKAYYTYYDLQGVGSKEFANDYSLSRRVISAKVALTLFQRHPVAGVGEGNIKSQIEKVYQEDFPYVHQDKIMMPHNHFLRMLAATGSIGLIVFLLCFYYPLFRKKHFLFFPLLSIYSILSTSFLSEDTLDIQLGLTFAFTFIMLNLHYLKSYPLVPSIRNDSK